MQKMTAGIVTTLITLLILLIPSLASAEAQSLSVTTTDEVIDVHGIGAVYIKPDVALLGFEVVSRASSAEESISKNLDKVNSVRRELELIGVSSGDVVENLNSTYAEASYCCDGKGSQPTKVTGYTASQSVTVRVKNEGQLDVAVDLVIANGATRIDSIYPDSFELNFGVDVRGKTAQETVLALSKQIQAIKSALSPLELSSKKNFTVTSYTIYPEYDYSSQDSEKKEYSTTHYVNVKVRDVKLVSSVINTALKNGLDRLNSTSFALENHKVVQKQARRLAFMEARERAAELAVLAEVNLGRVKSLNEYTYLPMPAPIDSYNPSMTPGLLKVEVDVGVVYYSKPR